MSSDSGLRKRNKDKKKKKGSTGDVNVPIISPVREAPSMKLVIDETIHVQKDTNFGGNCCSKLIFVAFLIALAGLMFFALSNLDFSQDEGEVSHSDSWFTKLVNLEYFTSTDELPEEVGEEEPSSDVLRQTGYLDILWELFSLGGHQKPSQDLSPEEDEKVDISKESNDEKYSREINESKESGPDEDAENDTNQDDDDRDVNENDENEEKEDDDNDNDDLSAAYESQDTPKPFNQYSFRYYRDEKDSKEENEEYQTRTPNDEEDDSPNQSDEEEEIDRRDSRYNYYQSRDQTFEEEKYKYLLDDDDANDSAEKGAREKFDSEENKEEDAVGEQEKNPEPDSHSSEETEHGNDEHLPEESEEDKEPQVEENSDQGESGNMITKLSVGTALIFVAYSVIIRKWNNYVNRVAQEAEALLNNGGNTQNDEDAETIAQTVFENVMDLLSDDVNDLKDRLEKNKTLQEYLETPSASENEQSEDDSANWQTRENIPLDFEESETASETEGDTENSESEPKYSGNYERANITNQYDWRHREEIDDADDDLDRGKIEVALEKYEKIMKIEPFSVRAKYGIAKCLDKRAEIQRSNQLLGKVIELYVDALQMPDVPIPLMKMIAERALNRMRFKGDYTNNIRVQRKLTERFPDEVIFHNELATTYLILNRISEAKNVLKSILKKWPDNGLALVNYGFALKISGDLEEAVVFLSKGIETNETASQDSRFYFHLGDALQKLNRNAEAMQVYEEGVKKGIFLSKYQRSLYNVKRLTAKPWWTIEESKYQSFFRKLISNWKVIRDEALQVIKREKNTTFREESEQLREVGDWRQLEIFSRGTQKPECKKVPVTCRIINDFSPAAGCRRGQVKFSLMEPGTHVWPHCGPTNCRLRAHLGLVVPANVSIRVADEVRSWKEGEILILDDSFEHEIWHNGTSSRLILIVDVWHPELTAQERKTLTAI